MQSIILILAFFLIAIVYSSVGFGGGSSYTAILVLSGVAFNLIAPISLISNIIVVSGNSINYQRAKTIDYRLFLMLAASSIPMAYLGGSIKIDKSIFIWLLIVTLFLSGIALIAQNNKQNDENISTRPINNIIALSIGAILGLVAGITGIGGGIFLSPILYHLRATKGKKIAATSSLFILVNSISGLLGQLQKSNYSIPLSDYIYLPIIVFIGGQLGNRFAIKYFTPQHLALMTALLIILASFQLTLKQLHIF